MEIEGWEWDRKVRFIRGRLNTSFLSNHLLFSNLNPKSVSASTIKPSYSSTSIQRNMHQTPHQKGEKIEFKNISPRLGTTVRRSPKRERGFVNLGLFFLGAAPGERDEVATKRSQRSRPQLLESLRDRKRWRGTR